eukprot:709870-Hanusia_phi.AAC.1
MTVHAASACVHNLVVNNIGTNPRSDARGSDRTPGTRRAAASLAGYYGNESSPGAGRGSLPAPRRASVPGIIIPAYRRGTARVTVPAASQPPTVRRAAPSESHGPGPR